MKRSSSVTGSDAKTLTVDISTGAILATVVLRDENERLPWFLTRCREMGVTKFLAVDNGSTDGSLDFLLSQPDVHLWQTAMSFNESNFDSAWFEILLSKYGLGHWTLMLDVDEILMFPGSEERTLSEFSQSVETRGKVAASGLMLDMYDDSHVSITHYRRGDDFLSHCPYFDRTTHHAEYPNYSPEQLRVPVV